jgi:hypothetical protein
MENLISLERCLAHGIKKAPGVAASVCGGVLAKPSPLTRPLFQGLRQLLTFKKYNLICKRSFKAEGDENDRFAFDCAWQRVVIVKLFGKSTPPHCFFVIPAYYYTSLSAM